MRENIALSPQIYDRLKEVQGNPVLLVVEDNPGDVRLLQMALARNGVKADLCVAWDGDEAILLLKKIESGELACPDLIVLDLNLPKRTGFEVLARVRASPKCGTRPVVILSSSDSAPEREKAKFMGASCYLKKASSVAEINAIGKQLKDLLLQKEVI